MNYFHVNTFTDKLFSGNPAAVCVLSHWLSDQELQNIAKEINVVTTAFIIHVEQNKYNIRWFTPSIEFDLCGHGTIAASFVIQSYLAKDDFDTIIFHTSKHGDIPVKVIENNKFELTFPIIEMRHCQDRLDDVFDNQIAELYKADRYIAVFDSEEDIINFHLSEIHHIEDCGLVITAPGHDCDFVSRYFAPHIGIPEDQATGSAHRILAPYWANQLGKTTLLAKQLSPRGGELECEVCKDEVKIAGKAILFSQGTIVTGSNIIRKPIDGPDTRIELSSAEYEDFLSLLDNSPEPNENLKYLFKKYSKK